jgi:hypothetical protein
MTMMSMGYKPNEQELADAGLNSGMANAYYSEYSKEQQAKNKEDLLSLMALGYTPTQDALKEAGLDPRQAQKIQEAYKLQNPGHKEIEPGSDVELAIMDAIDSAESISELASVLRRYSKYDPVVLESLAAKKRAELSPAEDDETGTDAEGNALKNPLEWALELIRKSQKG